MDAAVWRAFLLANYMAYVADMSVYCPKPGTWSQPVNPWTTLRSGDGYPGAVRFVQSLTKEHFETAVLVHEILAATEDYPDFLAFRQKSSQMKPLIIPSSDEGQQRIPGFLDVREGARTEDWSTFLSNTTAEEIPWWGFDAIATVMKLAAKAARLALVESGVELADWSVGERLEAIENQTHAIHGAQRPMWELQEDTKRAVGQVAKQQNESLDLLQRISGQLSRPSIRHAEASLQQVLGESVYGALTAESKAAALEGELRYLQGEYADPSVIPFQIAKAFECQLRSLILEPFYERRKSYLEYPPTLQDIQRMLKSSDTDFLSFLKEKGFDGQLLQRKIYMFIRSRHEAAHTAKMSEQRARHLRDEWLGVGRNGDSIFKALTKRKVIPRVV